MWTSDRQSSSLSTDVLARFANFKLAGDRAVRDVAHTIVNVSAASSNAVSNAAARSGTMLNARGGVGRRGRRRRRYTNRRHSQRRVGVMTDAELEAELAARRAQRARERDRYARSMRSDKLQVLEMELNRLRSKIGGGTPANPRWESLGDSGRGRAPSLNSSVRREPPGTPMPEPNTGGGGGGGGGPPPPPPMHGLRDPNEEEEIDPEKQKREKAERQRRREQKRKEREANKKPMTLADIIRSAGKNPIARLKPKGSTATEDVNEPKDEEKNEMENVTLKKAEKVEEKKEEVEESELSAALKKAAKGVDGKDEADGETKKEPNSEEEVNQNDEVKKDDEGKNPEPKSDVSPAPEKEDGKPDGESNNVETANGDVKVEDSKSESDAATAKTASANAETATEEKPTANTQTPAPETKVEQEPKAANGTSTSEDTTAANGDIKPQLEEVLSKLAVKKVLKDTVPSEKNMDQSPDKKQQVVADVDVENKEATAAATPTGAVDGVVEKPKLDAFLKNLAAKKKTV